jgi:putative sugar transferase wciK
MISDYVLNHYRKRYILDIRDYTYERIPFFKKIENRLIQNSKFTTISSKSFLNFIDNNPKIIVNHNISNIDQAVEKPTLGLEKTVKIGFVGSVRYPDENIKLIEALKKKTFCLSILAQKFQDVTSKDIVENIILKMLYSRENSKTRTKQPFMKGLISLILCMVIVP